MERVRGSVASAVGKPSRLPAGTQVAQDDGVKSDAFSTWNNINTLTKHVEEHAGDFGIELTSANAANEYVTKANEFFEKYKLEKLPAIQYSSGEIGIYEPETNTFGVYSSEGKTQSLYKPTSSTYFSRQVENVSKSGGKVINALPTLVESAPTGSGGGGGTLKNPDIFTHHDPILDEEEHKPIF